MHHGGTEITEELFPDRLLKRGVNEMAHELKLTHYPPLAEGNKQDEKFVGHEFRSEEHTSELQSR